MENQTYLTPGDAAQRLGVSASGLKRLAKIYAELYGPLPRDSADNRLWPSDAIERLEAARALVETKRISSIKEALHAVDRGIDVPAVDLAAPPSTLDVLRERLEALTLLPMKVEALEARQTEAIELLHQAVSMAEEGDRMARESEQRAELLQDTVTDLAAAVSDLRRRIEETAPREDGKPDYIATMEAVHADLERRHNVLLAELERRRLEGEQPKRRAWWRWWG